MDLLPVLHFSSAEFFTQMRRVTYQRQLVKGGILAKLDDTEVHWLILQNTFTYLHWHLPRDFGHIYAVNLQIKIRSFRLSTDHDLALTGPHEVVSAQYLDTLPNPLVIIEVLSPND